MANLDYFSDEDVISFTLLDAHTVERLQRDGDIKLPRKKVDIPKDERWNTKQMSSKLLQGILAGDAIPTIASSLMQVIGNNAAAAVRNARTMVTGAENVGRLDSYEDLAEKGVVQKKVWIATADDRTRESHLLLDGEEVDIDKPFSNGLMYPADPSGDPAEVYNCRCSMRDHIVGFRRADGSISYVGAERDTTSHAGKIEEEIAQRGLEKAAEVPATAFGNISEISADQFRESASENLTKSEQKELYEELDRYIDSVSGDTERLAELLDKMDDVKWTSADPLYRGIGVEGYDPISEKNTYEQLLESYRNGEPFTMQSLSWSASEDPATKMAESKGSNQIIYVDTTEGTRDMISIRGITEETEGKWYADNTQEVLATRTDMQFEPYKVEVDGNVAHVYVREIPAEAPAEAPAAPAEPAAVESSTAVEYKTFDAEADMQTEIVGRFSFGGRHSEGHEVQYAKEYKGDGSETTQFFADNSNNTELIDSMSANDMKAFKDLWSKGQFMQGQQYGDFSDMKPRFQSATRIFDKYLDQTTIDQNIEVVRLSDAQLVFGAGNRSGSLEDFAAMEGQQIICNANMSFSAASEGLRINYTGAAPTVEYVLRIPEGSNGSGMYIGDDRINVWGDRQREFMTNRNIWMTVGKTEYIEDRGIYRVELNYGGRMEHDYK